MRKILFALIVLVLFMNPVFAASTDGDSEFQDVYVYIEDCLEWETCQNDIVFNICCEDYDTGISIPSNLPTGRTSLDVWSNVQWNCAISHDAYTNGMPAGWDLECREDADATWTALTETPTNYWPTPQDPTAHTQFIFNYRITGITMADTWAGAEPHTFQVCYTVSSS
jgi:hypothetical protein